MFGVGRAKKKATLCSLDQQILVAHSVICTIRDTRTQSGEDGIFSIGGFKV